MRKILTNFIMALFIVIIMVCSASPIFAWTGVSTGWEDFNGVYSEFSMFVTSYYQNNSSTSVDLGYQYIYIDNWSSDPRGIINLEKVYVFDGYGLPGLTASKTDDVNPGDYYVGNASLGQTNYSKVPDIAVHTETLACEGFVDFRGTWEMYWWNNLSITTAYYD
jgi:hypothetical protein